MGNTNSRAVRWDSHARGLPATTTIAAAVFFALYGAPRAAVAQQADSGPIALQEITVTATRREEALEAGPDSLAVVNADQPSAAGVTDLMSLSIQVPGLSMYDYGARF